MRLILFLILASISQALGATWYVDPTGSDTTGTGAIGAPYRQITKALDVVQAGDTIQVAAGSYSGANETKRNGTALSPITIQGAGYTTITRTWNFFHDYYIVKDIHTDGGWFFYVDSNNCTVEDSRSDLNLTTLGGNIWMEPLRPSHARCHSHTIRNCQILNAKTDAKQCVQLNGTGHIIEGCYFSKIDNRPDLFWIWGYDHIIRNNVIEDWDQVPYDAAIHMDIFQTFSSNGDVSKNILVEGNFVNGGLNTQLGNIEDQARNESVSDWTFRNNVFANFPNGQIMIYAPRFKWYNNTFYKCATQSGKYALPSFRSSLDRGSAHGAVLRGNIWYLCGQDTTVNYHGFYDLIEESGIQLTGVEIDYNLVLGTGSGRVKTGKWTSYNGVAKNTNSLNGVDPLFVNPINATTIEELRLLPASPAIGAGQVLNGLFTTDYFSAVRGAAWDIGAIEYDVGSIPGDTTPPTLSTATIDQTGLQLTLSFDENVFSVDAAHYAIAGKTLGTASVNGSVVTFSITPAMQEGQSVLLNYTSGSGRTADSAGNLLATISNFAVTNNSLEPTPSPPRPGWKGRSGSGTGARRR